jgi:hypothetical protein
MLTESIPVQARCIPPIYEEGKDSFLTAFDSSEP